MTTYYVSNSGSNTNAGTGTGDASAWRTVLYACTRPHLEPGDTIKILPGIYQEANIKLTASNTVSGTSENPITLTANDTADKPIIRNTNGPTVKARQLWTQNVSWWVFDNLEFSDFNGIGVEIEATSQTVEGMTVRDCDFIRGNVDNPISGHTLHFTSKYGYAQTRAIADSNYFYNCVPRWNYDRQGGNDKFIRVD